MSMNRNSEVSVKPNLNSKFIKLDDCEKAVKDALIDCIAPMTPFDGVHLKSGCCPEHFEHTDSVDTLFELPILLRYAKEDIQEGYREVVITQWRREMTEVRILFEIGFNDNVEIFRRINSGEDKTVGMHPYKTELVFGATKEMLEGIKGAFQNNTPLAHEYAHVE